MRLDRNFSVAKLMPDKMASSILIFLFNSQNNLLLMTSIRNPNPNLSPCLLPPQVKTELYNPTAIIMNKLAKQIEEYHKDEEAIEVD